MFRNNIVYASSEGLFINNYTNSEPNPADVDYNLYYSSQGSSLAEFLWKRSRRRLYGTCSVPVGHRTG